MHELSVTESILSIALDYGQRASASRITDVHLVIGQLSSIVDDSVQFYWDFVSEKTKCEGSKLSFRRIPGKLKCTSCYHEFSISERLIACPQCGSFETRIIAGEEFYVDSIEIEKDLEASS